jgi:hypothetical protein
MKHETESEFSKKANIHIIAILVKLSFGRTDFNLRFERMNYCKGR